MWLNYGILKYVELICQWHKNCFTSNSTILRVLFEFLYLPIFLYLCLPLYMQILQYVTAKCCFIIAPLNLVFRHYNNTISRIWANPHSQRTDPVPVTPTQCRHYKNKKDENSNLCHCYFWHFLQSKILIFGLNAFIPSSWAMMSVLWMHKCMGNLILVWDYVKLHWKWALF